RGSWRRDSGRGEHGGGRPFGSVRVRGTQTGEGPHGSRGDLPDPAGLIQRRPPWARAQLGLMSVVLSIPPRTLGRSRELGGEGARVADPVGGRREALHHGGQARI